MSSYNIMNSSVYSELVKCVMQVPLWLVLTILRNWYLQYQEGVPASALIILSYACQVNTSVKVGETKMTSAS